MHAWYVRIRNEKTHTLSNLSFVVTFSFTHILFCTLTHSPSHALDLSRLRHSPRSIAYRFIEKSNITKFDHVRGEKELHLVRQTYTIRFTMRCSFVWCIFGIVDINNICVNLIKVSKVWLLKNLHALHYLFPPLSYLTHHSALSGSSISLKLYWSVWFVTWPSCLDGRYCLVWMWDVKYFCLARLVWCWSVWFMPGPGKASMSHQSIHASII